MRHPLLSLDARQRRVLFFIVFVLMLATGGSLGWVDTQFRTADAPGGIVAMEFARTEAAHYRALESWSANIGMNQWVAFSIGLDYLYMPLYATVFALLVIAVTERLRPRSTGAANVGVFLAWGAWAAAVFDAVENYGLLRILMRDDVGGHGELAFWCATIKFALLGAALCYALVGFIASKLGGGAPDDAPA